jgi:hypothetical protein
MARWDLAEIQILTPIPCGLVVAKGWKSCGDGRSHMKTQYTVAVRRRRIAIRDCAAIATRSSMPTGNARTHCLRPRWS